MHFFFFKLKLLLDRRIFRIWFNDCDILRKPIVKVKANYLPYKADTFCSYSKMAYLETNIGTQLKFVRFFCFDLRNEMQIVKFFLKFSIKKYFLKLFLNLFLVITTKDFSV